MDTLTNLYNKLKEESNREFLKTLGTIYFIFILIVFIFMIFIRNSSSKNHEKKSPYKNIVKRPSPVKKEREKKYYVETRKNYSPKINKNLPARFLISEIIN